MHTPEQFRVLLPSSFTRGCLWGVQIAGKAGGELGLGRLSRQPERREGRSPGPVGQVPQAAVERIRTRPLLQAARMGVSVARAALQQGRLSRAQGTGSRPWKPWHLRGKEHPSS